eukprot:PhM_4_TR14133/c4_g1_i3/m.39421
MRCLNIRNILLGVVLHVVGQNIPLPPFLGESRAPRETALYLFSQLKHVLALLDCEFGDVAYICADRSATNRAAFALVEGNIHEALEMDSDDDEEEDEEPDAQPLIHKFIRDNN